MNTDQIAAEAQTCCAHMRVVYERIHHEGGLCSDSWKCKDCGTKFVPEPFIEFAIEKAYQQGRKDGGDAACRFTRAAQAGESLEEQAARIRRDKVGCKGGIQAEGGAPRIPRSTGVEIWV